MKKLRKASMTARNSVEAFMMKADCTCGYCGCYIPGQLRTSGQNDTRAAVMTK